MWLCIPFPVRYQIIKKYKGGFTVNKKSTSYQINIHFSDILFFSILLNEENDVAIFILSHI